MKKRAVHGRFICAGLATPGTELLSLLTESVLEHVGRGPVSADHANNAHDQLIESLARAPSISVLLCERPELDFADACTRAAVPVVLAVPDLPLWIDPVIQAAETGGHGADPYSAVHAMFEVAAPLLDLAVAADPFTVTTSEILDDFTSTIRRLADYLDCDLKSETGATSGPAVPDPAVRSRIKDLHAALHQRRHSGRRSRPITIRDTAIAHRRRCLQSVATRRRAHAHRGVHAGSLRLRTTAWNQCSSRSPCPRSWRSSGDLGESPRCGGGRIAAGGLVRRACAGTTGHREAVEGLAPALPHSTGDAVHFHVWHQATDEPRRFDRLMQSPARADLRLPRHTPIRYSEYTQPAARAEAYASH